MQGNNEVKIKITQDYGSGIQMYSAKSTASLTTSTTSGGQYYGNFIIEWNETGVTGREWYTSNPNSPFYNATEEEIENAASDGNLSEFFGPWATNDNIDQEAFISRVYGCWSLLNVEQ